MIYCHFMKKLAFYIKKGIEKQTGYTKRTRAGLKVMQFFRKICVCHRIV